MHCRVRCRPSGALLRAGMLLCPAWPPPPELRLPCFRRCSHRSLAPGETQSFRHRRRSQLPLVLSRGRKRRLERLSKRPPWRDHRDPILVRFPATSPAAGSRGAQQVLPHYGAACAADRRRPGNRRPRAASFGHPSRATPAARHQGQCALHAALPAAAQSSNPQATNHPLRAQVPTTARARTPAAAPISACLAGSRPLPWEAPGGCIDPAARHHAP